MFELTSRVSGIVKEFYFSVQISVMFKKLVDFMASYMRF